MPAAPGTLGFGGRSLVRTVSSNSESATDRLCGLGEDCRPLWAPLQGRWGGLPHSHTAHQGYMLSTGPITVDADLATWEVLCLSGSPPQPYSLPPLFTLFAMLFGRTSLCVTTL